MKAKKFEGMAPKRSATTVMPRPESTVPVSAVQAPIAISGAGMNTEIRIRYRQAAKVPRARASAYQLILASRPAKSPIESCL